MSQNVENKVVEFQFNNSNFEKNVSKSMSTLEKLKNALNFDGALKGFDNLDRATRNFDMSSMEKSVGGMSDKFSALQTIAVGALIKIGEQAIVAGEQVAKALTIDQIAAGFDKYTNKVQSVATMYATGKYDMQEIEGSLSNLNTYTDKTSYSFSTLVDNMSKFTNAGVELQDAEKAMEGIGNWAALSGITAASGKVNQMAYNLSQAVGSGALLLQDWRSIENVNAATEEFKQTLIDTGLEMGTLQQEGDRVVVAGTDIEVTVNNLRNTLQKRWVNDQVLLSVLGKYADETTELGQRAQKAAAEARTLEDAVGAVSDAISTSWMATHETLFGDYKQATLFFTGLQDYFLDIFDSMNTARNELLSGALSNDTSWGQLQEMFETLSNGERTFEDQMKEMAKRYGYSVDEMIDKYGSMKNAMEAGEITGMTVSSAFGYYADEILKAAAATDVSTDSMTEYERAVIRFANGGYGKGVDAMRAVTEEGWDYDQMVQDAALHVNDARFGLDNYSEAQFNAIGFTKDQVRGLMTLSEQAKISSTDMNDLANAVSRKSGRTLLVESLYNSLEALRKVLGTVKEAWQNVFPQFTADKLYNLIEQFEKFTRKLTINEETADKLRRTFEGLFSIIDVIGTFVKDVFVVGLDLLKSIFGEVDVDVLDLTSSFGDNMIAMRDWVKQHDPFLKALQMIAEAAKDVIEWIKNMVDKLLEIPIVQQAIGWVEEKVIAAKNAFIEWAESTEPIQNGLEWIGQKAEGAFNAIKEGLKKILEIPEVANLISTVGESFSKVFGAIREFFTTKDSEEIDDYVASVEGFNKINLSDLQTNVINVIGDFAAKLTEFWNSLKELKEKAGPIFAQIKQWIKDFIANLGEMWTAVNTFVKENLGSIIAVVLTGGFSLGLLKIAGAIYNITTAARGFGRMLSGIGKALAGFGFKQRMDGIANVINAMGNVIKNIAIMAVAIAGLTAVVDIKKLEEVVSIMEELINVFGFWMIFNSVVSKLGGSGGGDSIGNNTLNVNVANGAINSMVQMAGAVLILAKSLEMLSAIPKDKLDNGLRALTTIIIEVTAVTALLGLLNIKKFSIGGLSLVSFATAVWILSQALLKLKDLPDPKALLPVLGVFTGLAVVIGALAVATKNSTVGQALTIIAPALAILMIAGVMEDIAKMSWDTYLKSMLMIGLVVVEFRVLMKSIQSMGNAGYSSAANILAIGLSLAMIGKAMEIVGRIKIDAIIATAAALAIFIGEFVGMLALMKEIGGGESGSVKAAATIVSIGASMVLLATSMLIISKIPTGELAKATLAVSTLMGGIALVVAASRGASGAMKTILALTAAVAVLMVGIAALSFIAPEKLAAATIAVDSVLVALGILVKSTENAKLEKVGPTIVLILAVLGGVALVLSALLNAPNPEHALGICAGMSLLFVAMAGALWIIGQSKAPADGALLAVMALTGVMVVIAGLLGFMAYLDVQPSIMTALAIGTLLEILAIATVTLSLAAPGAEKALIAVGVLTGVMLAIGAMLGILAYFNVEVSIQTALAIGILLEILSLATVTLSLALPVTPDALLAVLALTGAMLLIGAMLGILAHFDVEPSIETALAIGILLEALAIVTLTLSLVGPVAEMALLGAIALDGVVLALVGLVGTIGLLDELTKGGVKKALEEGLAVLKILVVGIVDIFATAVMNLIEGITKRLPAIGEQLSDFGAAVQPFATSIKSIDQSVVDSVGNLAKVIMLLAAAEIVKAIADYVAQGDSMSKFGDELVAFAPKLAAFAKAMTGTTIGPGTIEAIKGFAELMLVLAAKDLIDALNIFGTDTSLNSFADELIEFGPKLQKFSDSVTGIKERDINNAVACSKRVVAFVNDLPEPSSFSEWLSGETGLAAFGKELANFGPNLKTFSDSVEGVNQSVVLNAVSAARKVASFVGELPEHNASLVGWITGESGLAVFGEELASFGPHLKSFATSVVGISQGVVTNATSAALSINEFAKNLPDRSDSLVGWFTGESGLAAFGTELETFGPHLKGYSESVKGVSYSLVKNSTNAAQCLSEFAANLPERSDSLMGWFTGNTGLGAFGKELSGFAEYLQAYSDNSANIDIIAVAKTTSEIRKVAAMLTELSMVDYDTVSQFSGTIYALGQTGVTKFVEAFSEASTDIETAGKNMVADYTRGLESGKADLKAKIEEILAAALQTFEGYLTFFGVSGQQIAQYLASGSYKESSTTQQAITDPVKQGIDSVDRMSPEMERAALDNANSYVAGYSVNHDAIVETATQPVEEADQKNQTQVQQYGSTATKISDSFNNNLRGPGSDRVNSEFVEPVKSIPPQIDAQQEPVKASLDSYNAVINDNFKGFTAETIDDSLANLEEFPSKVESLAPAAEDAMATIGGAMNDGFNSSGFSTDGIITVLSGGVDEINDFYWDYYDTGKNIIRGLNDGIWASQNSVISTISKVMVNAHEAAREEAGVDSPSWKYALIGRFIDMGLANGISDNEKQVVDSMWSLGDSTLSTLRSALEKASNLDDEFSDPVITPVLDLSEIQNGAGLMSSMLQDGKYQMMGSMRFASAASSSMGGKIDLTQQAIDRLQLAINKLSGQQGVTNNNTFNIESNDPEAVALAVSDILEHGVERTNAIWA